MEDVDEIFMNYSAWRALTYYSITKLTTFKY